jgi:O-antigen/teichoic acid export membrane protein
MRQTLVSRQLLVGSAVSLALRVGGVALGYVAHVLLSRSLGVQGYGQYVILLGWALVLTLPTRLGMDNSALRYSTVYLEAGRHGALRAFLRFGAFSILVAAAVVALGMIVVGRTAGGSNAVALLWAAALIPPLALLGFASALLRTARRIFASQFYDQALRPAVLIMLIGAAALGGTRLTAASGMMLTALAAAIALVAILIDLWRSFAFLRPVQPDYQEWRSWYAVAIPLLAISIAQELLNQLEILIIGYLGDARMAGLFSAAWRLASLMPFGLQALAIIGAPMIASAYHRNDQGEMFHVARLNARIGLGFAALVAVPVIAAGPWLLGIFGPEFRAAYPALVILTVGGAVNAFTGVVAYFLTLTGRERMALAIFAGALAISLLLNVILIPRLGVIGAAIASSSALAFWNLAMLAYVRRVMGIDASAVGLKPRALPSAADGRR